MTDPTHVGFSLFHAPTFVVVGVILLLALLLLTRIRYTRVWRLVRRNVARFGDLVEHIHEVFYETDPSGQEILYISPAYEDVWGRTRRSLYEHAEDWLTAVHPEDQKRVAEVWSDWMTRERFDQEYRIIRPDGSIRWIWDRVAPVCDKAGKVIRLVGIAEDITLRKEAEAEIQGRSEQQHIVNKLLELPTERLSLEDLLHRSLQVILSTGWTSLSSKGGIFLTEGEPPALVLKAQQHLSAEMQARCGRVAFGHCLCGRAAASGDIQFASCIDERHETRYQDMTAHGHYVAPMRLDGQTLGVLVLYLNEGHPFREHEKRSIGMIASTVANLISRKRAEEALQTMNATLEQQVAERSRSAEERADELARANAELDVLTKKLGETNERLEALSLLDPLTGLLNRRGLQQMLSREVQWAMREQSPLFALLLDLDNFKKMNDGLGYAVGDVILKEIARKLKASVRATDHVARIGGDEFLILMPQTRHAEGLRVAEKTRLAISGEPVLISTGEATTATASLGLVAVDQGHASLDELISNAHLALQRSKQAGKNRVFSMRAGAERGQAEPILVKMLMALRTGGPLRVVAQPIVDLGAMKTVGYELLSRSTLKTFEMPDDFFRLSLDANMLTVVDVQCFRACLAAASSTLPRGASKHLNLFPSTLINTAIQDLLQCFLADDHAAGSYCIEISEQQIIGEPAYLIRSVETLRRAGFLIAIDDVGFGRSSLESLVLLEPEIIKIDRRCIHGIVGDVSRIRSLKRLLGAAGTLGSEVVAEGIESPDELALLRDLHVKFGQGFLLGKPAPLESFNGAPHRLPAPVETSWQI